MWMCVVLWRVTALTWGQRFLLSGADCSSCDCNIILEMTENCQRERLTEETGMSILPRHKYETLFMRNYQLFTIWILWAYVVYGYYSDMHQNPWQIAPILLDGLDFQRSSFLPSRAIFGRNSNGQFSKDNWSLLNMTSVLIMLNPHFSATLKQVHTLLFVGLSIILTSSSLSCLNLGVRINKKDKRSPVHFKYILNWKEQKRTFFLIQYITSSFGH